MKIIATFVAVIAIVAGVFYLKHSQATIDAFTITPTIAGTDDVAGAVDADYDISYTATDNSILTEIVLTLPSIYDIETGLNDDLATIIQSGNGTPTNISISGLDVPVSNVSFADDTITITLTDPYDASQFGVTNDIEFTLLQGITNPTVAGEISPSGFLPYGGIFSTPWSGSNNLTIDDDFADSTSERTLDNSFDIIAGPAVTLDFTTQPSHSPTPDHGDVPSAVSWSTQPVVTAYDEYGNVATSYDGDVVTLTPGNIGLGTLRFPVEPAPLCGGPSPLNSYSVVAVAGVANFAGSLGSYVAAEDHEPFNVGAQHNCGSNGTGILAPAASATLTADIVADSLEWNQDPADCVSGSACTTQGIVRAVQMVSEGRGAFTPYLDIDYVGDVTIGEDGAGSLVGTALQGTMTAGVLNSADIGYANADSSIDETTHFTADSGSLLQAVSGDVLVAAAGTPPTPPTPSPTPSPTPAPVAAPSGAGNRNPNPDEIPKNNVTPPAVSPDGSGACAPYLTAFLRFGSLGEQVFRLQKFLATEGSYPEKIITGYFGSLTEKAVKVFQVKYGSEILAPQGLVTPTGYAKDYTQQKINSLVCHGAIKIS